VGAEVLGEAVKVEGAAERVEVVWGKADMVALEETVGVGAVERVEVEI
jgi:hypothetical protein